MSKFKEGEEVKFIGNPNNHYRHSKWDGVPELGDIVTIDKIDQEKSYRPGDLSVIINGWWFAPNELQKIEQNNMSEFKPFYVEVDGENHSSILQEVALEEGFTWFTWNGSQKNKEVKEYREKSDLLSFEKLADGNIVWSQYQFVRDNNKILENPTLEEFRQALRGNYDWEDPIEIDGYEVEFKDEEKEIKVGCVHYTYGNIKNIYESLDALDIVCDESLKVNISHSAVGEIPFEVIESIYNRIKD